jgi:hypothetical protein
MRALEAERTVWSEWGHFLINKSLSPVQQGEAFVESVWMKGKDFP